MSTTPESKKIPLHSTTIKVRWGDMDAMGHVNNTLYFRYCEVARMEWFGNLDLSKSSAPDSQIVIINAFCEFLIPVVYPCNIIVDMLGTEPGNSSFTSEYVIRDKESPDKIYSNGRAKVVWVNRAGNKSVQMPDTIKQLFA